MIYALPQFAIYGSHVAWAHATRDIGSVRTTAHSTSWHQIYGLRYSEGNYKIDFAVYAHWKLVFFFLSRQGSIVFASLTACNEDPAIWENPHEFKPERFLDGNGQFSVKLDKSLPFGAGKRLCAGETFARNVIFLVATALIQNFNFKVPEKEKMPDASETVSALVRLPPQFWMRVECR